MRSFPKFYSCLNDFHELFGIPFVVFYADPTHGDLLPINNDENLARAISSARPFLRLFLQRKGEDCDQLSIRRSLKKNTFFGGISNLLPMSSASPTKPKLSIGMPEDFRQVSQIVDVGPFPETCRRVRLIKHGSERPLGFYIRDGTSVRVTPQGLEKVPGIFISRLLPGGLAEGTGLLAVNDEVLEVNGIEVLGKTLDQVTDMMVANSCNLIIKIRPATLRSLPLPATGYTANSPASSLPARHSPDSSGSHSGESEDEDEVKDHLANDSIADTTTSFNVSKSLFSDSSSSTSSGKQSAFGSNRKAKQSMPWQQQSHSAVTYDCSSGGFSNPNFQYATHDDDSQEACSSSLATRHNGSSFIPSQSNGTLKESSILSNLRDNVITLQI